MADLKKKLIVVGDRILVRPEHGEERTGAGLYLTGQDVMTPGIAGAFWGGMFGAAAIDSRLFRKFR